MLRQNRGATAAVAITVLVVAGLAGPVDAHWVSEMIRDSMVATPPDASLTEMGRVHRSAMRQSDSASSRRSTRTRR